MSLEQNKPLTNPFAEESNVVKVRIAETGDCEFLPLNLGLAINAGATLATFTNNLSAQRLYNVLSARLTDGSNEAVSVYDAATAGTFTIDTTAFDVSKDWVLEVFYAPVGAYGVDCPCQKSFTYKIVGTKASFAKTFNASQAVAVLAVKVDGSAVADGAAATLAAASVNDVVIAVVNLENTGVANLNITDINVTGDGSVSGYAYLNGSLEGGNNYDFLSVAMDTATAGAKTATVTIATDEAANPIYTIDIDLTVA